MSKVEKVVLVALTEKEVKFIKSQTRSIHNWLLKQDKERGYVSKQSDETRTLTGSIGGKLSFANLYLNDLFFPNGGNTATNKDLYFFAVNYNVLRIEKGFGGLLFS